MPGRRPKPTELKKAAGNPGHRALPTHEPASPVGIPLPPEHLSPGVLKVWAPIASMLHAMGVLQMADSIALERLCAAYAEVIELELDIRDRGRVQTILTKWGEPMDRQRPQVSMLADADRRLKSYLVEFGLTPAARSKVHVEPTGKQSDEADFFDN